MLHSLEHLSTTENKLFGFSWTDKPYIRLLPQLSPKLAHQGLSVEVNEGEDLELSVLIEAYPHITEHRWHTPTSPNTSTQEHKFNRYNNRYNTKAGAGDKGLLQDAEFKSRKTVYYRKGKLLWIWNLLSVRFGWIWQGTPRSLYFRSWNCCWREEWCSLFSLLTYSAVIHRNSLNSNRRISHFGFCRHSFLFLSLKILLGFFFL